MSSSFIEVSFWILNFLLTLLVNNSQSSFDRCVIDFDEDERGGDDEDMLEEETKGEDIGETIDGDEFGDGDFDSAIK
jgi:hypothetical protein